MTLWWFASARVNPGGMKFGAAGLLIRRPQPPRLRQAHDIPDFDGQPAFRDRDRNWIARDRLADLRVSIAGGTDPHEQEHDEWQPCMHESSSARVASDDIVSAPDHRAR